MSEKQEKKLTKEKKPKTEIKKKQHAEPKIPQIIIEQPEFEGISIPKNMVYVSNEAVIEIKLIFENEEDETTEGAWIGLYPIKASDEGYVSQGPVKAKGKETKLPFQLPRAPGIYHFRYFPTEFYVSYCFSLPLRVGPYVEIKTKLSDDNKSLEVSYDQKMGLVHIDSGWVGLVGKDGKVLEYHYIKKATGNLKFKKPIKPQEYKVKLFWEDQSIAESEPIKIEGKDSISLKVEKNIIIVQPSMITFDAAWSFAWIGLYKAEEKDPKKYIDSRYVGTRHNITFSTVEKGDYIVKVFPKYSSYSPIVEEKITVE